ncbi:hypothetical protein F442_18322 [Phytophthora nicotianae P10297]|uniref:Uncharacterized protein n=1 Tax=Phytophthora nicotianae P10297 TaxID=1317064 RepID=W2YEL2_PHYNI|nr:hypothetical protein F442_18322 [Phytophthora nicotianae P10297]
MRDNIDYSHVRFWSEISKLNRVSLADTVRLFRGETSSDPRPNKDLYELRPVLHHDMTETLEKWNNIVRHGVIPRWTRAKPQYQDTIPANHRSINGHGHSIRYHLHKGQLEGRYLIMEANLLDQWPEIFVSPLAVVDKPGAAQQDIRLINDYSFPPDASVNDYTDRSDHSPISYNPPRAIARPIYQRKMLGRSSQMLLKLGDVAGAFRHVSINAEAVHMFCFRFIRSGGSRLHGQAVKVSVHWNQLTNGFFVTNSRYWSHKHSRSTSESCDYIDSFFDDLSAVWERCCSATPWQSLPIPSIARTGMLYKKMGWSRWLKPTNAARRFGYFAAYCWAEGSKRHHVGNKHSTIVLKMASV